MYFVIPFFKNTTFLRETIQSLVNQTDTDWTATILDDSIENGESIAVKELVSSFQDSRISLVRNSNNLGLAQNWNQGLDLALGHEFCVILHADDRLCADYVLEMRALAQKFPEATGFFSRVEIIGENAEPVFSFADFYKRLLIPREKEIVLQGIDGIQKLIPGNFIFCPAICYRMGKIKNERFLPSLKMVTDFEFVLRILKMEGAWVGYDDHALFQYRRHGSNTTNSLTQNLVRFKEEVRLYLDLSDFLKQAGHVSLAKKAASLRIIKLNLIFQILKSLLCVHLKDAVRFFGALVKIRRLAE